MDPNDINRPPTGFSTQPYHFQHDPIAFPEHPLPPVPPPSQLTQASYDHQPLLPIVTSAPPPTPPPHGFPSSDRMHYGVAPRRQPRRYKTSEYHCYRSSSLMYHAYQSIYISAQSQITPWSSCT